MAVVDNHQEMENTVVIKGQQEEVEEVVEEGALVMDEEEGLVVMDEEEWAVVLERSCRFCGSRTGEDHVHFQLLHPVQVCSLQSFLVVTHLFARLFKSWTLS